MRLLRHALRSLVALALVVGPSVAVQSPARALTHIPDSTWMAIGKVYATAIAGNTLFIGGTIKKMRERPPGSGGPSYPVVNLAAINLKTGVGISSFTPEVTNTDGKAEVRSLAVSPDGSTLYVGGTFDAIDGVPRMNLGAVSTSTGAVVSKIDAQVGPSTKCVCTLLASASRLYLGGNFKAVDGAVRRKLAAIGTNGTLDADWKPRANRRVRALTFAADGTIFIGGGFEKIDGVARQSVARVSADTGALHPWSIPAGVIAPPQNAWSLVATPTRLYGGFGAGPNYAAAFRLDNGNTGTQLWRFNTVGNVQTVALSPSGSKLFIGGHFGTARLQQTVCGDMPLKGLALLSATTGAINCAWVPTLSPSGRNYNGAWSYSVTPTHVWVGGVFRTVAGVEQRSIARFTL